MHTDALGHDLPDHEVRVYLFASAPHGPLPQPGPGEVPHRYPRNLLKTTPLLRALLVALDAWATHGTPPPPSQVPTGSGVSRRGGRDTAPFPGHPWVACPEQPNRLYVQSFGPDFDRGVFSKEPPEEDQEREYIVLLPQVDVDGLEVAGIRTPDVEVPLATYTGWNLRPTGSAARDQAGIMGSGFPFARTAAERQARRCTGRAGGTLWL